MDFSVLGSIEVAEGDSRLNLGGPKQRTVLALLLASAGHGVTVESLITGVYGEDAAPSAKRTIHTYVSNLRQLFGHLIERQGDFYRLVIDPIQFDAVRFETLYAEGAALLSEEPESAARLLREALGIWRGHAYAGIDGGPIVAAEVRKLEELRLSAIQRRIDADLALGMHLDVIGELEALVAEDPYQEHFRAQLMLALYRSDRQTDALRAYTRVRLLLAEELGVEPGAELQLLEERILVQDPSLDLEVRTTIERRAILVSDLPDHLRRAGSSQRDAALASRDAALDIELSDRGGVVVGIRGTAAYAAIPSVVEALEVAQALCDQRVKVAIDFGDVEIRDNEVSGAPVGRSARLVAASHPGQVVISEQAHAALNEAGVAGWSVKSLGRHQIRGVGQPLMIFQATGHGHDGEFPPLVLDGLPPPVPGGHPSIAGYELRDVRNEHDYGVEYLAYQHSVGREVSLLAFHPELVSDVRFIRRFEAEAHRLAQLDHPNLVPVLDYWREPERAVIVSRLTDRSGLTEMMRQTAEPDRIVALVARIGRGLAHAHDQGVVHGALNPSSISLDLEGNPSVSGLGPLSMTEGIIPLKFDEYSAPELLDGQITPAADMFSLATITAELLSGRPLPRDRGLPPIPGDLGEVIHSAVQQDPSARPSSMAVFIDELLAAQGSHAAQAPATMTEVRNPYKGLSAFTESEAGDFFGRDELTAELIGYVASGSLTLVVGPSGIGKSSVVRAGLVPALRSGAVDHSENWLITDMFPGGEPFEELAGALSRIAVLSPTSEVRRLRAGETTLAEACRRLTGGETTVIVVDQFEELYTHVMDQSERQAFLATVTHLAGSESGNVKVVATLRADFFDRPLEDPDFGEAVRNRIVVVPALNVSEMAEAVRRPAQVVGVHVGDDLAGIMAEDAAHEPGGLPLLQYTLAELFDNRQRDRLTLADYQDLGGLVGSIGRRAEYVYLGLTPEARAAARAVFLRLVTVDEESGDTRRRVRRLDLERQPYGGSAVAAILDAFGRARLLTFDRDAATRGPTVELAHEAILREWDRLVGWIDAARDDLLTRRRVEVAAREWDESGREPSYLLGGARLELTEGWHDRTGLELTDVEDDFLVESRHAFDAVRARRRRGRRRVVAGLIAATAAVSVLGLIALIQGRAAEQRALENRVAELTNEALVARAEDPDLAILLALEAYETSLEMGETPLEVLAAMQRTAQESRLVRVIDDGTWAMAASPDGQSVVTHAKDDHSTLRVYDLDSGERRLERSLPSEVVSVAYDPDGSTIAVAFDFDSGRGVSILDAATLEEVAAAKGPSPDFISFSDDGRFLAGIHPGDLSTMIWSAEDGYSESRLEGPAGPPAFLADSSVLVRSTGERLEYIDAESRRVIDQIELLTNEFSFVTTHPDGDLVAVANSGVGQIDIVSREQGRVMFSLGGFVSPEPMAFTTDGDFLVAAGTNPTAIAVELDTKERTLLAGHGGRVALIDSSGDRLLVQSLDRGIRLWQTDARGVVGDGSIQFDPGRLLLGEVDPESDRAAAVVTQDAAAVVSLVEASTGVTITRRDFFYDRWAFPMLSEDGRLVAGLLPVTRRGAVIDLETDELLIELRTCEVPNGLSHAAGLVAVAGDCFRAGLEEGSDSARTGLVSLTDDSLVRALPLGDQFGVVGIGIPGTVSEDLVLLPDGSTVKLRRISTGEEVGAWSPPNLIRGDGILPVGFSEDGAIAYVGYQTGLLAVFDVTVILEGGAMEEALRFERQAHQGPLKFAQAAGDSIVTAGAEVKVWDLATGELQMEIPATSTAVIAPDGSAVYYDDGDTLMRRVPITAAGLAELARSRVTRGLTADECLRFLGPEDCTNPAQG